jgi:hypothetical protein
MCRVRLSGLGVARLEPALQRLVVIVIDLLLRT